MKRQMSNIATPPGENSSLKVTHLKHIQKTSNTAQRRVCRVDHAGEFNSVQEKGNYYYPWSKYNYGPRCVVIICC